GPGKVWGLAGQEQQARPCWAGDVEFQVSVGGGGEESNLPSRSTARQLPRRSAHLQMSYAFRFRPRAASCWKRALPYFLRPMEAARASGSLTPFRRSWAESRAKRSPVPSL